MNTLMSLIRFKRKCRIPSVFITGESRLPVEFIAGESFLALGSRFSDFKEHKAIFKETIVLKTTLGYFNCEKIDLPQRLCLTPRCPHQRKVNNEYE
jgi:hypothetical protein